MKRRLIVSLILGLIILVSLVSFIAAPSTSTVLITCLSGETDCLRLPSITGTNVNGDTSTFPSAFTHPYQLVIMPFDRDQQTAVREFLPLFEELLASRPDLGYYSLAALPDLPGPIRLLVTGGLRAIVTDARAKESVYIFYLSDQAEFLQALGLESPDVIRVYLFDQAGNVVWQSSGEFTPELADEIRGAIGALPTD
jgi:hypothetical protein